jgi:8-oxo-dGTP pyrophosphatase MutT (NUDIX family)
MEAFAGLWPARIAEGGADALVPHLLAQPTAPKRGDFDLNPDARPVAQTLMPAAVLLPIVRRAIPSVLFTQRTAHLARHAGQVSFPGGRTSPSDRDAIATALRETEEETGIAPHHVRVAGFLESYETGTGFAITPVVGIVDAGFALKPNPDEVAEVFEVPLSFLLDLRNRETKTTEWAGMTRRYYAYTYGRHYIWGATAGILAGFVERLAP